jgi:HPt (histidine-containing phosphotransfer) domain-containing protein
MDDLAERFRARFVETARERIRIALAGVDGEGTGASEAAGQLHTLAGEAGALGYPAIMALAQRAQSRLAAADADAARDCASILREIAGAVEDLAAGPPPKQHL